MLSSVPLSMPFSVPNLRTMGAESEDFLALHSAVEFGDLHEKLWALLTQRLCLHSCSLYLNYLGDDREFQVLHRQVESGHPLPWMVRRQLSPARVFLRGNVGIRLYRLENLMPDRNQLEGSPYFRQVMQAEGWCALLSLCIWDQHHPRMILTMRKSIQQGNFSSGEIDWVQALQPHFEVASLRIQAVQHQHRSLEQAAALLEQLPAGVALLDSDGTVSFRTARADRMCLEWNAGEKRNTCAAYDAGRLPAAILRAVEKLDRDCVAPREAETPSMKARHPRAGEIRIAGPGNLRASIRRTWTGRESHRAPATLIVMESVPSDPAAEQIDLTDSSAGSVLSSREYVVAQLVAAGMTNEEIAAKLFKSVNTIKSQVASALRKLKLGRRIDLVRLWRSQPIF